MLAWWHAVPQAKSSGRQPALIERQTRQQISEDGGKDIDLPPLDAALQVFIAWLFEAGPVSLGASGAAPLTWADLHAWQLGSGNDLAPWQLRLLRRLSSDYVAESHTAGEADAPPPWAEKLDVERRAVVARHIKKVMRGET